jgi:hypothetical protein
MQLGFQRPNGRLAIIGCRIHASHHRNNVHTGCVGWEPRDGFDHTSYGQTQLFNGALAARLGRIALVCDRSTGREGVANFVLHVQAARTVRRCERSWADCPSQGCA